MEVSEFRNGWVLVVAEFFVVFLIDGMSFTFGLFLVAFLDDFGESRVVTSFAGSIVFGVQYILGPIAGSIADKFGSRPPIIIGTLMSFAGFFASSFAKSIPMMCFTYGLLGGTGFGLMFLPANACVIRHFNKRRALANGLAFCGTGFGTITFSLLINHLIFEYGWRRALFIMSGVLLNGIPCALLLVSPRKDKGKSQDGCTVRRRAGRTQNRCMSMLHGLKCTVKQIKSLVTDTTCFCIMMSGFFVGLAFTIPASILPDQVIQIGMSYNDASWLVSSIGLSTIVGRIMFGWFSDKMVMYRRTIFESTVVMQGISIAVMPLLQTFQSKLVLTCAFGFTMGGYAMLYGVVLADEFGPEQIGKSYGLNIFAFGLSTMFAVPIAGWIYDVSHNYDLSFYLGGVECLLAVLCLLATRLTTKFKQTNSIIIQSA